MISRNGSSPTLSPRSRSAPVRRKPLLFLIDTPMVNAAALGSHDKGIVLFTRGMLDKLDRSETEAVAARLVSAIGAGDLHAATGIMAVFRTLGFFLTVLDLPLRWSAWRTLGGLLLVSVTRRAGTDALGRVGEGLEAGLEADAIPNLHKIAGSAPVLVARLVQVLLLPFYLVSIFYKSSCSSGRPCSWDRPWRCYGATAATVPMPAP